MRTLREYIKEAEEKKIAIGHFNISNLEGFWGVFNAAKTIGVPIIIGVSEGERDFIGLPQIVALVRSAREQFDFPIFLNADHSYSYERVREAIDAGFDMVIFDGAKLSRDENIAITRQCVEYAKASGKDVLIEAELGYIGSGSDIKEKIPEGAVMKTDPAEAKNFVEQTGVDLFAPAVGNIHGIIRPLAGNYEEHIDAALAQAIRTATGVPLVLHGGSGLTDDDFTQAVLNGISVIHISTELRIAYKNALKLSLQENPDEIAPYKILRPAMQAIQKTVEARLKLFNRLP